MAFDGFPWVSHGFPIDFPWFSIISISISKCSSQELPHVLESGRASRSMDSNSSFPSSETSTSTAEDRASSSARRQKQMLKQEKLKEFLRKHRFSEAGNAGLLFRWFSEPIEGGTDGLPTYF